MSLSDSPQSISEICRICKILPILTVDDVSRAVPLARALLAGGVGIMEIPVRSSIALDCIDRIRAEVPEMVIGAGTLLCAEDIDAAMKAGAQFGVSPGFTPSLLDAIEARNFPFLPAAATPSEMMLLAERGFKVLKFFPAEDAGGASYLKQIAGPLPDISFCPTGGIGETAVSEYLDLPNVLCVGGSWPAPKKLVQAGEWGEITELAARAAAFQV